MVLGLMPMSSEASRVVSSYQFLGGLAESVVGLPLIAAEISPPSSLENSAS